MSQAITAAQIPAIAERLPPFPRVVPELLDSLQSDTLSVDNLVRIARNDSVIAAAILSGANGLRRLRAQPDTADLFAAASLIGTNKLKQIIVKLGLNKLLSEGSGQAFFYEHSLAVAIVAQELAQLVPGVSADEAYIAGILHDIGQLAYFVVDAEAHRRIRQQAIGDGNLLALEAAALASITARSGCCWAATGNCRRSSCRPSRGITIRAASGQTSCRRWSTWLKP
jgi:HD-like signal output (HDOD) protein